MKLLGEGGTPKPFVMYGELKSSISSLKMMPVERDITLEPKLGEIFNMLFTIACGFHQREIQDNERVISV